MSHYFTGTVKQEISAHYQVQKLKKQRPVNVSIYRNERLKSKLPSPERSIYRQ